MARPQSQQLAGFFPTPPRLLPRLASVLRWPSPESPTVLLDPCAADGAAIRALRDLWIESTPDGDGFRRYYGRMAITACELEAERAAALKESLGSYDIAFHGDAFRLCPTSSVASCSTILYLNPPYDHDRVYRRLEHRFLVRFTEHLHAGAGYLLFLVPHYALEASAEFLARHYLGIRAWRLPEPEFSAFGQVLLVARRARRPLAAASFAPLILRWASEPLSLPELPDRCPQPFLVEIDEERPFCLDYKLHPHDLTESVAAFRPWRDLPVGTSHSVHELFSPSFKTAMPPRPVHIVLGLYSGVFNGEELLPNDPLRHPPLLAKGIFERQRVPDSERFDQKGNLVATVDVEQPSLLLTVLRLDTYTFHQLLPGAVPAGGDDFSIWNTADLIANYDQALSRLLARRFPPLFDPARRDHRFLLPRLARTPYPAQAAAIRASLMLLATGENPFVVGQVGTGKCTIALTILGALLPQHHATTIAEMRRLGLPDRVRQVERILIFCPPHLVQTWTEQCAAVLPDVVVQVLRTAGDLRRPAQVYLLTRENAKLGHSYQGLEGRCPRCGAFLQTPATANATRRLRCSAVSRRPKNRAAGLALILAALLAPSCPNHPLMAELVTGAALRRRLDSPPRPFPIARLLDFHEHLLSEIEALYSTRNQEEQASLLSIVKQLLRLDAALGTGQRALPRLEALVADDDSSKFEPCSWVSSVIERLQESQSPSETEEERLREMLLVLEVFHSLALWEESPPCGEPLYQALGRPRRYPLARLIRRYYADHFHALVLDEGHENNNPDSAQSHAAHRLSSLPGVPTILLSGSLMGGYASDLFPNLWALSRAFREDFARDELSLFVERFGYRELLVTHGEEADDSSSADRRYGAQSDRTLGGRTRVLREAPGIVPLCLLRYLLPIAVFIQKADLDLELPPPIETVAPIRFPASDPWARELREEYERLQEELLARIRADRFDKQRAGRLLGALVELPSYLDLATDDLAPFEIRYPEHLDSELIAVGRSFPSSWRTPKEIWLLDRVAHHLHQGHRVVVFLRHTGSAGLPHRLLRLLKEVTPKVIWLDAKKVPTSRREAWIDENVIAPGMDVLLVNAEAVETGLNNLTAFSTALWYEYSISALTMRQAPGRIHRIGQTRQVTIETAFYARTAQQILFEHVANKVTVSLQVDALDLRSALQALSASAEHETALSTALSLGEAVYRSLSSPQEASLKRRRSRTVFAA